MKYMHGTYRISQIGAIPPHVSSLRALALLSHLPPMVMTYLV